MTWMVVTTLAAGIAPLALATMASPAPVAGPVTPAASSPAVLTAASVNDAALTETVGDRAKGAAVLRAQILLDRARFSPGEIDAEYGSSMRRAIAAFQANNGLEASGIIDPATWAALNRDTAPVLSEVTISAEDVAGPFVDVPADMMEKSKLPALGYRSALEALGEKFHASPGLLQQLNPGKDLTKAGEQIIVPSVEPSIPMPVAAKVVVDKSDFSVSLVDAADKVIARYPASTGSEYDPLPVGEWTVKGVSKNPVFNYNPDLFWDANPAHAKAPIAPGPNNPVGVVWIDLSKEHYGIHGTPEPSKIGKTESHGCIRMTNWSAIVVAEAIKPGAPAILQE